MSLADVPSRAVTSLPNVMVVPEIDPLRIITSYVFASEARNTYDVPEIILNATEKFGVLYESVPRDVHVAASGDDAYAIAEPLYQNAQWVLEAES